MKEENKYFNEIKNIIENVEINKKVREYKNNYEDLMSKWNIGKLLVEAQGGEKRAKYGDNLIKKWSNIYVELFGKGYDTSNLKRFRQFYILFPKGATLSHFLSWSHIVEIIPLKNENERNYYINQVILNNLSVRELRKEIKSDAYGRLSYTDKENIKLIEDTNNYTLTLSEMIKDPIIIPVNNSNNKLDEKALHKLIIEMLENKFLELGKGFALIGHEYKFSINNKTYKIDLLFFNVELNEYIVVEIKTGEFEPKDISQVKFYMNYIDNNLKKEHHSQTEGILIVKKKDKFVLEYISSNDIFITSYKLQEIKKLEGI